MTNLKTLALGLLATITVGGTVAPSAQAFLGPSNQDVCEHNLSFAQDVRNKLLNDNGVESAQFTGKVSAQKVNPSIQAVGFHQVTGCMTQFTFMGDTYLQSFNVEIDKSNDQYYVKLGAATKLN